MAQDILEGLNPRQREAVEAVEGPLLIVAGPGSGKTRVIVHRVAYLVKVCGVSPYRICAVTFTNKAAREMRERLLRLLGPRAEDLTAGTFHATCAGILRREGQHIGLDRGFAIYDDEDQLTLMKRALEELNLDPKRYNPRAVHGAISRAKAQLVGPEEFGKQAAGYFEEVVHRVYAAYQALLQQSQAVDFDDLLMQTYRLFRDCPQVLEKYQSRYVHLLIDEFQDTNVAQYALARQLAGSHRNICVVGDPDQSIYSWRHADIRNILSFQRDFPDARVVALDENYRSTQVILEAAQRVIAANQQRLEKHLFTRKERGAPVVVVEAYDEDEEARWVLQEADRLHKEGRRYGDCAVMYRVNAQSRALEEGCLRYGVPYRVVGALRFYQRREVKDVIAYLRLALNLHDEVSFARVANVPPRGIGQRTLDELVRWARAQGVTTYAALESLAKNEANAPLPSAGQRALLRFYALLGNLATASQEKTVVALLDYALERTGYRAWLEEAGEEGQERWENLLELRGIAREFDSLEPREGLVALLERVALVSDVDNLEAGKDALTLITLHQAKGLEFPVVFMVGMEEGLLPHARSRDDPAQMEEERRLCYVGMTRAQERLYLVRAFRRHVMGGNAPGAPSRFLRDIPPDLIASPTAMSPAQAPVERLADGARLSVSLPAKPLLRAGDRVRHAVFGEGVVVSCVASGHDHEVTVAFNSGGVKRLLYSYAPLEKVGQTAR